MTDTRFSWVKIFYYYFVILLFYYFVILLFCSFLSFLLCQFAILLFRYLVMLLHYLLEHHICVSIQFWQLYSPAQLGTRVTGTMRMICFAQFHFPDTQPTKLSGFVCLLFYVLTTSKVKGQDRGTIWPILLSYYWPSSFKQCSDSCPYKNNPLIPF